VRLPEKNPKTKLRKLKKEELVQKLHEAVFNRQHLRETDIGQRFISFEIGDERQLFKETFLDIFLQEARLEIEQLIEFELSELSSIINHLTPETKSDQKSKLSNRIHDPAFQTLEGLLGSLAPYFLEEYSDWLQFFGDVSVKNKRVW
jgi:hypothetical protein